MRKGRKEVTRYLFKGISNDGGMVFRVRTALHIEYATEVKLIEYQKGIACLAFDHSVHPHRVAEIVAGSFSKISNFKNVEKIEIAYRNIRLAVTRAEGKRNIISMLMKAFKTSSNVKEVPVDMKTCQIQKPIKKDEDWKIWSASRSDFYFDEATKFDVCFANRKGEYLVISSLKDGIISVYPLGGTVDGFCRTISRCFDSSNTFYGIKGVEMRVNQFSMLVNERNVNRIMDYYDRCWTMDCELWKQAKEVRIN